MFLLFFTLCVLRSSSDRLFFPLRFNLYWLRSSFSFFKTSQKNLGFLNRCLIFKVRGASRDAGSLYYHTDSPLSRAFFNFFQKIFQQLFRTVSVAFALSNFSPFFWRPCILPNPSPFVNPFFQIFLTFFEVFSNLFFRHIMLWL